MPNAAWSALLGIFTVLLFSCCCFSGNLSKVSAELKKKQQRSDDDEDSLINSLARCSLTRRGLSYVNDDNNMLPDLHISRVNYS